MRWTHERRVPQVDIYALGLILYFMSSAQQPFHELGHPENVLKEFLKGNEPRRQPFGAYFFKYHYNYYII